MCTGSLRLNNVHPFVFAAAIRELLEKGRGKFRNILIVGPSNCGKTFLLTQINKIFKTFQNPATPSYAWLGVEYAEVIFLNDFRWSSVVIALKTSFHFWKVSRYTYPLGKRPMQRTFIWSKIRLFLQPAKLPSPTLESTTL